MVDEVQRVRHAVEELKPCQMLFLEIPADDFEVFLKLLEAEILFPEHGLKCRIFVGKTVFHAAQQALVDELELVGALPGEGAVGNPKGIDHAEPRELVPFLPEVVVMKARVAVVVKPERVVADEEGARRIIGHWILRHDMAHIVIGACAVSFAEDDLQQAMARRRFRRKNDALRFKLFDRLLRYEEDARYLVVRAHAEIGQDDELLVVLGVKDGRDAAHVKISRCKRAIQFRRDARHETKSSVCAMRKTPGERQDIEKMNMSHPWLPHEIPPCFQEPARKCRFRHCSLHYTANRLENKRVPDVLGK